MSANEEINQGRWTNAVSRATPALSTILALLAIVAVIMAVTWLYGSVLFTRFVTEMFISMTLVIGLHVFMGNTNILWFPHVGFMGIGAYASVIFSMAPVQKMMSLPELYPFMASINMEFLPAILCGALATAVIAAVIGLPLMRLSDFPAVIAGFSLLVVIHVLLVNWTALTNGPQTLFGVERHTYALTAAVWAGISIVAAYLFKHSRIGLKLRASREDLVAARTIGVNIMAVRWVALVLSAFMAGLGGGLYAHYITSFMPDAFFLNETFVILSMLVIGGPATISGAVVGTIVVTVFYQGLRMLENSEFLSELLPGGTAGLSSLALAVTLIAILIWRPGGLIEREEISLKTLARIRHIRPGKRATQTAIGE